MAKVRAYKIPNKQGDDDWKIIGYCFVCPACDEEHLIYTNKDQKLVWEFNGNLERPTFRPSLLLRTGHYVPGHSKKECWCSYNEQHPDTSAPECKICHSIITKGKIQYCGDCTHDMAGKVVDLPEIKSER